MNLLTEAIVTAYVTHRQSIPTIATAHAMPRSTVRNRLIAAGVKLRTRREGFALAITARRIGRGSCTLGVGCNENGVCYADANGQPSQCGAK